MRKKVVFAYLIEIGLHRITLAEVQNTTPRLFTYRQKPKDAAKGDALVTGRTETGIQISNHLARVPGSILLEVEMPGEHTILRQEFSNDAFLDKAVAGNPFLLSCQLKVTIVDIKETTTLNDQGIAVPFRLLKTVQEEFKTTKDDQLGMGFQKNSGTSFWSIVSISAITTPSSQQKRYVASPASPQTTPDKAEDYVINAFAKNDTGSEVIIKFKNWAAIVLRDVFSTIDNSKVDAKFLIADAGIFPTSTNANPEGFCITVHGASGLRYLGAFDKQQSEQNETRNIYSVRAIPYLEEGSYINMCDVILTKNTEEDGSFVNAAFPDSPENTICITGCATSFRHGQLHSLTSFRVRDHNGERILVFTEKGSMKVLRE